MEAPQMQQAEASPFLHPAHNIAGYYSYANYSYAGASNAGTPHSAAKTTGLGRKRILLISACLGILAVIAIAIGVGVQFGMRPNSSKNNNSSNNNSNNNNNNSPVPHDPNDPSTFQKDPNLKNSFYGISYTARDSLYPECNQTLADTIVDMQLLSQITTRIRLYGANCNQTALALEAIKQTKTNIKVFPAIDVVDKDDAGFQRQKTALQQALQTYGTDNILGIIVGNEFMLNYTAGQGVTEANITVGLAASAILKTRIADIRQMLTSMRISLPVGTSDADSYFNNDLLGAVDFGMSNVHPWYDAKAIQDAATYTFTSFQARSVDVSNKLANKPQMYIGETGWPTFSSNATVKTNGASEASEANLQIFLNNFVCTANTQGVKYFFNEFTDVPWRERLYPGQGVASFWGLFNSNKRLKAITLPDCIHD